MQNSSEDDFFLFFPFFSNLSRPSYVHPVPWLSWLLSVRPIIPIKGWYPLPIPEHSSNSNPIHPHPLLPCLHNTSFLGASASSGGSWYRTCAPHSPYHSPYEAVLLFAIRYIHSTAISPAMPRLGDGGVLALSSPGLDFDLYYSLLLSRTS